MFTITQNYVKAESLSQAYDELMKNRNNRILGGGMWMRQGRKRIPTLIDLSALGLDTIAQRGQEIEIGCMATLRDLETSPLLTGSLQTLSKSVSDIVGVQFRNTATVGGSVYGRYGFSDFLTALLALDCTVHLYHGGKVPMRDFVNLPYSKDIVEKISLTVHDSCTASYQSLRRSATDFPVIALAVSKLGDTWTISVGARPHRAALAVQTAASLGADPSESELEAAAEALCQELVFGGNMRASADYRREMTKVLFRRAARELLSEEHQMDHERSPS